MNKYDIQDQLLTSTGPTEIIDLGETGGSEYANIVLVGSGAVEVEGCATPDGVFDTVMTATLTSGTEERQRIPYACPRYIRLASTGATLTVRV